MSDYQLSAIENLIERTRGFTEGNGKWLVRYLRLQSLFVYFQYAVASVHTQEENIAKMAGGQHKNFSTHAGYEDCLLKIYSGTVNAYSNIRTCLEITRTLIEEIGEDRQDRQDEKFKTFRNKWIQWVIDVVDRRDRVSIHPARNVNQIAWKPSSWIDDGRVTFRVIDPINLDASRTLTLHPRRELEELKKYLAGLSEHVARAWGV
jgi:hypothetical protein